MQTLQTIALLGGTGKAGRFILNALLDKGYQVKALIRQPQNLNIHHPKLVIIEGDAGDAAAIDQLLLGCQTVISALGQRPGEPLIATKAAINIVKAMQKHGISRYIFISGLNLDVQGDAKSESTEAKSAWMRQHFPEAVADKQQAYELTATSNLNWTMVRISMLEQNGESKGVQVSLTDSPGETITAADLAAFVIEQIDSGSYSRKAPFIGS